jgi:hypothetical protein
MRAVGGAYDLHYFGQVIRSYEDVELDSTQCQALPEELAFIAYLLNDPAVADVAARISELAARGARTPGASLRVEFPELSLEVTPG